MNPAMMEGPRKRQKRDGARWSRSGCLTCKKRRKRCDETKPSCHNCARLGRVCEGYGSLWAEPLNPSTVSQQRDGQKRRKLSSSPVSSTTRTPDSAIDIVSPLSNLIDENEIIPIDNHSHHSSPSSSSTSDLTLISPALILTPTIPSNPTLTPTEAHYLQYHIEQGSKLLANLENHDNPLRALLVPRALASPLVMKATCAMSAMHFANRAHDGFVAKTAATRYYIRTVRELRGALECFNTGTPTITNGDGSGMIPDDLILAVGLLCKYEIVRGSVKQWAVHLDALRKLFAARGRYTALDSEAVQFLWGFFTYTHNVAKVTNRRYRYISNNATSDVNLDVDVDVDIDDGMRIRKLDIYMGYTEDILKLCARIADLPTLDRAGLDVEVANIDHALQIWTPTPPSKPYILPRGFTPGARTRLQAVAECFRDAAYIYLHSMLERIQVQSQSQSQSQFQTHSPGLVPESEPESDPGLVLLLSLSTTKQQALDRCLNRISVFLNAGTDNNEDVDEFTICPRHCEYSALTFPLFIAGCECWSEMQMGIVVSALGRLEVGFGIGNVKRVKEVLGVLWAGGDCDGRRHWLDVLEDLGWELIVA